MEIPAVDVKKLRDRTGMSFALCRDALVKAEGDIDKAVVVLREKHKDAQNKLGDRETAEGRIGTYIDPKEQVGAIIEVRCESAPVAKSGLFVQLATDLARQVAVKEAPSVEALLTQPCVDRPEHTINERIGEVVGLVRENMKVARFTRLTGILGSYVHHDGTVGVMVQVEGAKGDDQMLRDVSMHVTARNPLAAVREHLAADRIAKETEIAATQAAEQGKGKPPNIVEMIAAGKMKTWFAENVLVEQPFVRDDSKTVGQLLGSAGLKMVRFVRYKVGEAAAA